MKNIERKYAYYDEGNLPAEGVEGVTYLTLYSSEAGNTYDGWIWDPDRIHFSATERTFGYRYPLNEDYCWDDEVIVDLSNAQNRKEASEYETGRITSFNTNVSDRPIVLNDVDILGLTEEERESKASMVLFTPIPLIKTAYIHAEIEVSMKMNISPDNTNGNVRVEAFYILNNTSDRVMRPNPVNHYAVTKENEYHTMRLMYWNPAVNHENHNYIGVKLLVTGGTAEIGISSNPAYGDAIITVASNGLTGDHIESGDPESISISGKFLVPYGYRLRPSDYTVLCTYDTDEVYNVSSCCNFTPEMWTEVTEPEITLTAEYMGLYASMTVGLADIVRIELMGIEDVYSSYTLNIDDYMVLAYFEDGEWMEVTDQCTFSPAMGTAITQDTVLTATYSPSWMEPGTTFTDSLTITKHTSYRSATGGHGLIYTLYDNRVIEITGTADYDAADLMGATAPRGTMTAHEIIEVPSSIFNDPSLSNNENYILKWAASGTPAGLSVQGIINSAATSSDYRDESDWSWSHQVTTFLGFKNVHFTSVYTGPTSDESYAERYNTILFDFENQGELTSDELSFLNNVDNTPIRGKLGVHHADFMFAACRLLTNLDFVSNWNTSEFTNLNYTFQQCYHLLNVDGLTDWDVSDVTEMYNTFAYCEALESSRGLANWDVSSVTIMQQTFYCCYNMPGDAFWFWRPDSVSNLTMLFSLCKSIESVKFFASWDKSVWRSIQGMCSGMESLEDLQGLEGLDFSVLDQYSYSFIGGSGIESAHGSEDWVFDANKTNTPVLFGSCANLTDISALANWDMSVARDLSNMFKNCSSLADLTPISGWDTSRVLYMNSTFENCSELADLYPLADWDTSHVQLMRYTFAYCNKARYIGCLSGWTVSSVGGVLCTEYMFARNEDSYIYDADSLNWNVPKYNYTDPRLYRCEPAWQCLWFYNQSGGADASHMFEGTSVPAASTYSVMKLSDKEHPLPYWYYHNDKQINELA